jgi:hydrogenase expression/formation protein HypC
MCLAVPAKIMEIDGVMALVEVEGVRREGNLTFVPEAKIGDYVLIHAGFAIQQWGEADVKEFNDIMSGIELPDEDKA